VSSFTIEEAKRAKLTDKDNWKNFASDMLFARALTRGQRRYAPDVAIGSVYAEGEIADEVQVQPEYANVKRYDSDDVEPDVEVEIEVNTDQVSPETLAAINDLWPQFGTKRGGKLVAFADYVHQQKGVASPELLRQDEAEMMLRWLQQRALATQSAATERETVTV
jgi:hypothetical protein